MQVPYIRLLDQQTRAGEQLAALQAKNYCCGRSAGEDLLMRIDLTVFVVLCLALVSVTGNAQDKPATANPPPNPDLFQLVAGTWGWSSADCQDNPHTIAFSEDTSRATFTFPKPIPTEEGRATNVFTYRILYAEENRITMYLEGETRRTDNGDRVVWVLELKDKNTFAWRSTDWAPTERTDNLSRCPTN